MHTHTLIPHIHTHTLTSHIHTYTLISHIYERYMTHLYVMREFGTPQHIHERCDTEIGTYQHIHEQYDTFTYISGVAHVAQKRPTFVQKRPIFKHSSCMWTCLSHCWSATWHIHTHSHIHTSTWRDVCHITHVNTFMSDVTHSHTSATCIRSVSKMTYTHTYETYICDIYSYI